MTLREHLQNINYDFVIAYAMRNEIAVVIDNLYKEYINENGFSVCKEIYDQITDVVAEALESYCCRLESFREHIESEMPGGDFDVMEEELLRDGFYEHHGYVFYDR